MPGTQQYRPASLTRGSLSSQSGLQPVTARSSIVPQLGGERLWKPLKYGPEYTTSTYGILKILIIGMSCACFISLMITVGGHVENGRYACFFASTSVTCIVYTLVFALSRLRVWDPRRPSLPHQIERLFGFIFILWNFISAGLVAPTSHLSRHIHPKNAHLQQQLQAPPSHAGSAVTAAWQEVQHEPHPAVSPVCLHNLPAEICRGSTTTAAVICFLLSAVILVNFFLSVWWGPPLRYSMRLKNITEGEKYQNFTNEDIIEEETQE
ncbi:uncharacterized protein LOC129587344 [Paramacrobiotus metropolitanus]|uniref:uncharacterized protein LOC129587344 n=1 Tax=Paramacrobiotus metropolitanus TaxID=2943436 RepID=UPI002445BE20|nr:uncharacterized protein LOC129587344 [Paramacrobiotus metropolitanus]XP_055337025.1 uncharacterized protein LOC129587344 [Paramacrobiotus metropolitanus]